MPPIASPNSPPPRQLPRVKGVKNIIAIASGKGGVGKSTTAVNIALALATRGSTVGLLDADIYGPSIPTMMGLSDRPDSLDGQFMEPLEKYGVQVMSIGFLVAKDTPAIWRGPMATQALDQLLRQTRWRSVEYLIIDLPPGTGDVQLTLSQRVPVTGAVIVTTPQEVALIDATKALKMFTKVQIPILGVVENMATHTCSHCGHTEAIFGTDGGKSLAQQYHTLHLGTLPLSSTIRYQADIGEAIVKAKPQSIETETYIQIAYQLKEVIQEINQKEAAVQSGRGKFSTIPITKA